MQHIISSMRKANEDYNMIEEGDKIAEVVGVAKEMEDDGTLGNRAAA